MNKAREIWSVKGCYKGYYARNAKLGQKGRGLGHVTYFLKFWDPSISPERVKLKTPNLARKRTVRGTKQKMENWIKRGMAYGHVT